MKFLKKTLKTLLCASLVLSLGISATACSTDDDPENTDNPGYTEEPGNSGNEYVEPPFTPPDDGSEGIDWSKYWDGVTSTGSSSDNFKFTGSKDIGTLTGDYTPTVTPAKEGEPVIVVFSDGVAAQSIDYGGLAVKPTTPEKSGYQFVSWHTDQNANDNNEYDFSSPVLQSNLHLYANWATLPNNIETVEGNHESIAVTFKGSADTTVQYKQKDANEWKTVDSELVRSISSNEARVDILGLAAGKYNVKIGSTELAPVTVDSYDRSGYAHFNRKSSEPAYSGVGAYNDDGTLKDDALVIYVTDENKDTVMEQVCEKENIPMFTIPGSDWKNQRASGIGWWLNNNQYTSSNAGSKKNKQPSNTYDATNGGKLGFKSVNRPIVIRFIGTVTTPEGCTAYDDTKEGGGVGDNGHMARMKNLKNVTLEGVGDDAVIQGWGFHYVIGTDATNGQGTSFEVRNLTFNEYPEDAIGMEGQQAGGKITAAVSRCWIHNNTFLPGRCDNPAESDKAEGDGSCDFKRGEYYTCSYNYFEYCHKTNLIGSADDSLQYNISMHHNMWYQCSSRIPLLRQANVHFYNNYVYGDQNEKTAPYPHISKLSLSYVHSLRANCYLFSEANYYEGSKELANTKSGGSGKSWNDVITQCCGTNDMVTANTREQTVSNSCAYNGTSYSSFDTNPSLFYYDSTNKKTDALLDDPVAARTRCLYEAGALGFEPRASHQKTKTTPQTNLSSITLPKGGKAKGEVVVFALTGQTQVTITGSASSADAVPELYDNYGRLWLEGFTGTRTVILPKGTYIVAAGQKDKECVISAISFEEGEGNSDARVEAAQAALAAIPSTITLNSESIINEAKIAYSALVSEDERNKIESELIDRYSKASVAYEELLVEYVVQRIDYIGTVTADSYVKINSAQTSYNKLSATNQTKVTNYSTLTAAWQTYAGFEVENVINRLNDLPDLTAEDVNIKSSATVETLYNWFNAVQNAYNDLNDDEDDKRDEVPTDSLKKLTDGLAELKSVETFLSFKEALANATVENVSTVGGNLVSLYDKLTDAQKTKLSADETSKYEEMKAAYEEVMSQTQDCSFNQSISNTDLVYATRGDKNINYKEVKKTLNANGTYYQYAMKIESGMQLTINTTGKMVVRFYVDAAGSFKFNGKNVTSEVVNGDNVITVTLENGGAHLFERVTGFNLIYLTVSAA